MQSSALRSEANAFVVFSGCFTQKTSSLLTVRSIQHIKNDHIHTPITQRRQQSFKRLLHSTSSSKDATLPTQISTPATQPAAPAKGNPLECLPLSSVLRTYFMTAISSSPFLLESSTKILRAMLESKNPLFRIDSNPVLRALLLQTFYKQFCAGNEKAEIEKISNEMRQLGFSGVILEYALEVLKDADTNEAEDVATWRKGMLVSVDMSQPGDFVGLKWSGLGPAAMRRMAEEKPPSPEMDEAMNAVCKAAAIKDISLLPAAEETWNLKGYHTWTLGLQKTYNIHGKSVIYNTYQAYLKQTPGILAEHLVLAEKENFTLGAKLVRGAYLATEKRDLIFPTIEDTHNSYDQIMTALIERKYNDFLKPAEGVSPTAALPPINVVIASHNAASVTLALKLREAQLAANIPRTPLCFAQLQGMADEVSCSLIAASKAPDGTQKERVLKCTTWGTMFECLNYLLRRAAENKDAASRTSETRIAMGKELRRRFASIFGLA